MAFIRAKQILKIIAGKVYLAGIPNPIATTVTTITGQLTTALLTAGDNGRSVPLQAWPGPNQEGIPSTSAQGNLVEVYDNASKQKLSDTSGREVYGRIKIGAFGWQVFYYVQINGVESVYTIPMTVAALDFAIPYYFSFRNLPTTFATGLKSSFVSDDPAGKPQIWEEASVAVTAPNTLAALPSAPAYLPVHLFVNGKLESTLELSVSATVGSTTLGWTGAAGYNLATTDKVIARWRTQ